MGASFPLRAIVVGLALLPAAGVLLVARDAAGAAVALALGPLAAGGAWAVAHRTLAARVERLAAAADRIATGDLSARDGLRRGGLGRLGRALDALAGSVAPLWATRSVLEASPEAIVALDPEGRVTFANGAAAALLGATLAELHGRVLHDVVHRGDESPHPAALCPLVDPASDGRPRRGEDAFARAGERPLAVEYAASAIQDRGAVAGVAVAFHEAAAQRRVDERLRHADRMDAVAQLAGGVAHDFNNLLAVVLSSASHLRRELPDGEARREADEIARAARRGAALVQQLLAFGRRAPVAARDVDAAALVRSIEGVLRRAAGDRVALALSLAPDAGAIHVDPGALEQALVALVLNSREAMPEGGTVAVAVAQSAAPAGRERGRWVRVEVRDDGAGMTREVASRVFDPFFTTKPGGGGLGLPTVYAFVKGAGGEVELETGVGRGTAVRMLLPGAGDEGQLALPLGAAGEGADRVGR